MPNRRIRVLPYKLGSLSSKTIAQELNCLQLYPDERSRFRPRASDVIINWGNSRGLNSQGTTPIFINPPSSVNIASDKLQCLKHLSNTMAGVDFLVPYTEDKYTAECWLEDDFDVFARTKLRAHSGEGIVHLTDGDEVPDAPLYTMYIPKVREYRIHIFNPRDELEMPYHVAQKRRRLNVADDDVNWQIRNCDNGFVYTVADIDMPTLPPELYEACKAIMRSLDLDFAALDVIRRANTGRYYILEVNTAPGISGESTRNFYVTQLKSLLNNI